MGKPPSFLLAASVRGTSGLSPNCKTEKAPKASVPSVVMLSVNKICDTTLTGHNNLQSHSRTDLEIGVTALFWIQG